MDYIHAQELSEKYMSRRTVSAHEPTDVMIRKIGFINNEKIGLLIDVAGDDFILELSNTNEDLFDFIEKIPQAITEVDDINGEIIQLYFNEDMTRCGVNKNNYIYNIKLIDKNEKIFSDKNSIQKAIQNALFYNKYKESTVHDKEGCMLEINKVKDIDSETFLIKSLNGVGSEIEWEINTPLSTEKNVSQVSRLIEEQGGGHPSQLIDSGRVVVVHKSDVDRNLNIISYDKTGDWAMVVPSVHKEWEKYTPTQSTVIKSNKQRQLLSKRNDAIKNGLMNLVFIISIEVFSDRIIPSIENSNESSEALQRAIENIISLSTTFLILFTILAFILSMVYHQKLKSTFK